MSDATNAPKKTGQRRRRRRGGRNNTQNNNRSQEQSGNSNKSGSRTKRRRPRRQPVKLSFWEKILVALGLKKDPNMRRSRTAKSTQKADAPKSNIRNARSKEEGEVRPKPDSTRKRRTRDSDRKPGDASSVKSNRVYVGNLSFEVTEQDLKELFKGVGNVRAVEIVYNRNTHRSKGYGFVDMMNKEDAIRSVVVLHDQPFMGRNMTVSGAKDKSESTDPDELEPTMEIKASDLELAPLPEKVESDETSEPAPESVATVEATQEAGAQTNQEATIEANSDIEEEQTKQA